jgi:hypothetical protein
VKNSIKKPVGGDNRGKNKTDWSTEEKQKIMVAAVRDWDSKLGNGSQATRLKCQH